MPDPLERFLAAAAADPAGTVVALDFDGTLAPIVDDPTESRPADGAMAAVAALARAGVRVVLVTGRAPDTAAALAGLDAPDREAGLERVVVHGHYGLQSWHPDDGGGVESLVDDAARAAVGRVREALPGVLADAGAPDGVAVEDKDVSLVVHTRRAPDPQATLDALVPALQDLADREGLALQPGKLVAEIRPGGTDKGTAVAELLDAAGVGAALFAGDDLGDLPGFEALAAAPDGVATLGVGTDEGTDGRVAAAADLVVDGPDGVVQLLNRLLDAVTT